MPANLSSQSLSRSDLTVVTSVAALLIALTAASWWWSTSPLTAGLSPVFHVVGIVALALLKCFLVLAVFMGLVDLGRRALLPVAAGLCLFGAAMVWLLIP